MSNKIVKTFYTNAVWTCPAGVANVKIIPSVRKNLKYINDDNTIFLDENNDCYACGYNAQGQIGSNDITVRSSPTLVVGGYKFSKINAAQSAFTSDGTLYMWGANSNGQLGVGDVIHRSSPVAVTGTKFKYVLGSNLTNFGLSTTGALYSWGYNLYGGLGVGDNAPRSVPTLVVGSYLFKKISIVGNTGCMGLTSTGAVYSWGANPYGQLGVGDTIYRSSPTLVLGGYNFVDIWTKDTQNAFGLTSTGALYAWGSNAGVLGVGDLIDRSSPTLVAGGLTFKTIVTSGTGSTFALTTTGKLYAWGTNNQSQLGVGDNQTKSIPTLVLGSYTFKTIITGNTGFIMGLTSEGSLYAWGNPAPNNGQLGVGDQLNHSSPTLVLGGYSFKSVIMGDSLVRATATDGKLYAWGLNGNGQLGLGDILSRSSPTLVVGHFKLESSPDDSRISNYPVIPGTTYSIFVDMNPSFGNYSIASTDLEYLTIEYDA